MSRALHLFYQNLRLKDNPSLFAASKCESLLCLYIHQEVGPWSIGSASKVWLYHSLKSLASALKEKGAKLRFAKGDLPFKLKKIIKEQNITDVFFDVPVEPGLLDFKGIEEAVKGAGAELHLFYHSILFDPASLKTKNGEPYQVFTPFYRASMLQKEPPKPIAAPEFPRTIHADFLTLEDLHLLPKIEWDRGFFDVFEIGEEAALKALKSFCRSKVKSYKIDRDFPHLEGTSKLSPHLHFGEISPHTIYHELDDPKDEPFKRQLIWREFAHHLLWHFPKTPNEPLKDAYKNFPWHKNVAALKKWQKGQTGIPIVDAGMRQLWTTGWMHNRVRMIVGSFLVKDLLIPWQEGAKWFWDTLVDADLANNTLGWQWVAGCGADAAPYFRIFNPYIQSAKFDPEGEYIKKYVPELKDLDAKYIHTPHLADESVLRAAGIELGKDYPLPMVDHAEAKEKALKIYYNWNS